MRYKDIRIVEANLKEAGSYEGDAQTFCRAIKRAASNKILNPNGLARLRAAAEEHVRLFPQDRDMINKCFADGGEGNGNGQGNGTGNASGNGNGNGQGNGTGKGADNNIATDDGATANGGGITGIPGNQNNTNVTGDGQGSNKLKAAADELSRLLDKEDWQGAKDLINGNPDLQATVPSSLKKDLDAAVQAQTDAAESNRLAQEAADAKVAADKKAAQDKADTEAQAAAEAAAESNRLAQEEKRLADEAEQKRNATAKAEADAAEAKRQSDAAEAKRLADAAEANRKAAEQLEADKEEAAKAAADAKATADAKAAADAKPGSTPPTEKPTTNQDSFDWEDL